MKRFICLSCFTSRYHALCSAESEKATRKRNQRDDTVPGTEEASTPAISTPADMYIAVLQYKIAKESRRSFFSDLYKKPTKNKGCQHRRFSDRSDCYKKKVFSFRFYACTQQLFYQENKRRHWHTTIQGLKTWINNEASTLCKGK